MSLILKNISGSPTGSILIRNQIEVEDMVFFYTAETLDSTPGTGWINNPTNSASLSFVADDVAYNSIKVRNFDSATEEFVAFTHRIPASQTNLTLRLVSKALTGASAGTAETNLYFRQYPNGSPPTTAWSSAFALNTINFGADTNWVYTEQTIALTTLGLAAGLGTQFLFSRNLGTLPEDMSLTMLEVEYS